jgi:hypothetical protein
LDNSDAFISFTVEDNNEFAYIVACGRSGNAEVLKTSLNTGYGTRHWKAPFYIGNGSIGENVRRFNEKI